LQARGAYRASLQPTRDHLSVATASRILQRIHGTVGQPKLLFLLSSRAPARDLAKVTRAPKLVGGTIYDCEVPNRLRGSGRRKGVGFRDPTKTHPAESINRQDHPATELD